MSNTQGGWRPDGQLPPEYEPVHHEPRRRHGRRQDQYDPRPDPRGTGNGQWGPPEYNQPPRPMQPAQPYQPYPPAQPYQPQPGQPQPGQPQQPQWQQPTQWQQPPQWEQQPPQWQEPPRPGYEPNPGYEDGQAFMPGFVDRDGHGYDDHGGYDDQYGYDEDYEEPAAGGMQPRKRRRSKIRILAPWIAILVILIPIGYGGYYAYSLYQNKYHPADYTGDGTGSVTVQVQPGDTASSLGPELLSLGVVESSRAFVNAAEKVTTGPGMEPGFYKLRKHMSAASAYAILDNPANIIEVRAAIPEGYRASQIIAALVKADPALTASAYQQALTNPSLGLPSYAKGKAEGYLFPATYQIQPNDTPLTVLQHMVTRFNQEAASVNLTTAATAAHLNPAAVIVVASLLQAEGGRDSDFPKIAEVVYNRLARGMPLQFDSSVCYGLDKYCFRASNADLASTSPYNTYKYKGLPPGPIDSPGDAAIQAALHPATGSYLYFVTVNPKTGLTEFASTYQQFLQLQQQLNQNTGQG